MGVGLLAVFGTHAQSCSLTLSGLIKDEQTGEPVPLATVVLLETGQGAVSDSDGYYVISGICPGTYTVQSRHLGCDPMTLTLEIAERITHNFVHHHHVEELGQPVIVAYWSLSLSAESMSALPAETVLQNRGRSLSETLEKLPGVRLTGSGTNVSKPVVQGLQGQRLLIMNNEIRQEAQQWGNEHAPEMDAFLADEPAVITGPSAVRYGPNAVGGVLLISQSPLKYESELIGGIMASAASNGGMGAISGKLEGGSGLIKGLGWRLQGTLKAAGNARTPDAYLNNTGMHEANFSYTLGWKGKKVGAEVFYSRFNTRFGIFTGAHIGNLTDLNNAIAGVNPLPEADFTYRLERPRQQVMHELTRVKTWWAPTEQRKLTVTLGRQFNERMEFDLHGAEEDDEPQLRFGLTTYTLDVAHTVKHDRHWHSEIGLSGTLQANTQRGRYFIPDYRRWGGGAYGLLKRTEKRWEAEISGRYDAFGQRFYGLRNNDAAEKSRNFQGLAGGAGFGWKPRWQYWLFQVNTSAGWRPPAANELFADGVHHGAASYESGNPNLRPEQAWNNQWSVSYTKSEKRASVKFYHNLVRDFILLRPEVAPVLTILGAFPAFAYENVDAALSGMDFSGQWPLGEHWTVSGGYSLLRARNVKTDEFLPLMPADAGNAGFKFTLPGHKHWRNAHLGPDIRYQSRQWRVNPQSDFAPAPPAFTLLNFRGGVDIGSEAQPVKVRVGVENVLNIRYRDYMNRFRYFHDERGRNFTFIVEKSF